MRAFYRDFNDPKNAEKYAEMSEVSADSKGKCRWEREAEDEYSYYAEVFGQDVFHMQKLEHPISAEDQQILATRSQEMKFKQWQEKKYEGERDPTLLPTWQEAINQVV